jgi:phosphatidylglycerophosphate synthase
MVETQRRALPQPHSRARPEEALARRGPSDDKERMLDRYFKPRLDPVLDRLGKALAARGASADLVTLAGLILGLGAAALIVVGQFWAALALLILNRLVDGLDGAVARARGVSPFGAYWDIVADFTLYGAIPLAFALHDPAANAVAAAFLIATYYVNGASFLGYSILAERHRMQTKARGRKGFYHTGGLLEGTETIAIMIAFCIFPTYFPALAIMFGALCLLTAVLRLLEARRLFGGARLPGSE